VYTNSPGTVGKLYKQRLRWIYGFINNTIDYKNVIFDREYGNFSVFTLPTRLASVVAVGYLSLRTVYTLGSFLYSKYIVYKTIGINLTPKKFVFDPFFLNTQSFLFLSVVVYFLIFFSMIVGKRMIDGKWSFSSGMLYFFPVFLVVTPFWLAKALYNTILKRKPSWR
jgi:cellulose synthase/poly-beta-1,6-N-acetylglucosamine synthase-like glycosyltransferase